MGLFSTFETVEILKRDAQIASLTAEIERLREELLWYACQFCEEGPYSELCGRLSSDDCAGCHARAALQLKEDK